MKPTLLILAAGMGSRYGGLKQVDPVGPSGEAIIDYSIFDAIRAGFGKVVFVIRESFAEDFIRTFRDNLDGKIETGFVFQELDRIPEGIAVPPDRVKPWGTGHAVLVAKDMINEPFAVINADDFYGPGAYRAIADHLSQPDSPDEKDQYCMVGYELSKTLSDFGSVSRGVCRTNPVGLLIDVVERTKIERKDGGISYEEGGKPFPLTGSEVVSMNIWGFFPSIFGFLEDQFAAFIRENAVNPKAEFYIPFAVNELIGRNLISLKVLETGDEWFGVTYREDRPEAVSRIRQMVDRGIYPDDLWENQ
ncbi:MAG: nucleotidyltransferase [Bacteroidales bacterium]|nr:nucleotidyltransferase [Bacteroidales bacterium]